MKNLLIVFLFLPVILFPQKETHRWSIVKSDYSIQEYKNTNKSAPFDFLAITHLLYKNVISEYDGNNCRFSPSCSEFFLQSVRKFGFLQGFLMFADRFTRDLNYFNSENYPKNQNDKLIDPPEKYAIP